MVKVSLDVDINKVVDLFDSSIITEEEAKQLLKQFSQEDLITRILDVDNYEEEDDTTDDTSSEEDIKTEYILRYITDADLRRRVQLQLNKGEYRHKLPRWIFFVDQGEFRTGDYEEIMNKASCLSLVSNAVLYWNTIKIGEIVDNLRQHGEIVDDEILSHISLLPFKHVLPNGTYFIDEDKSI